MIHLFLLLYKVISTGLVAIAAISFISGGILFFIPKLKSIAPFVMFIPSLGSLVSIGSIYGLGYLFGSLSNLINSSEAWEVFNVLSLIAYPVGLLIGGITGITIGTVIALVIRKWQLSQEVHVKSSSI